MASSRVFVVEISGFSDSWVHQSVFGVSFVRKPRKWAYMLSGAGWVFFVDWRDFADDKQSVSGDAPILRCVFCII